MGEIVSRDLDSTEMTRIPNESAQSQSRLRPARGTCCHARGFLARSTPMMDVVMLAIAFVFFAVSIAYVYACDQL
jgi:hypothetical protein